MKKWIIDLGLMVAVSSVSIAGYHQYIKNTQKVYVVDAKKIGDLKNTELLKNMKSEKEVEEYYDRLQKTVEFSSAYINKIGAKEDTLIYSKNTILTTNNDGKVIDITDNLINELKRNKLLIISK